MTTNLIVSLVVVTVLLAGAIGAIVFLLVSKTNKHIVQQAKKQAVKEKQVIIGHGYKEINDQKKELKKQKEEVYQTIAEEYARLAQDKNLLEKMTTNLTFREEKLNQGNEKLIVEKKQLDFLNSQLIRELEIVSGLDREEAKRKIMKAVEQSLNEETNIYLRKHEAEVRATAQQKSAEILTQAMEKYWTKLVDEKTIATVKIEDEDLKGRIIGREGRNIKAFEQYGGVEIIIDETPNIVQVSSFNPIRREIAVQTLKKLINDGRIQPVRIEQELQEQERLLDQNILETGQKVIDELGIVAMDPELIYLVGKLKYRTSYSQSVLIHSIEVAKIAGQIAVELNLDSDLAIRAGLLHDIGKALDFEQEGSHVSLGYEVAKKYGENAIVLNAIAAHHEDVTKDNVYSAIVAIADGMSAARPGARNNLVEDFNKRMQDIENVCNNIPGVARSYAVQSGRQIRVIIDPIKISDFEMLELSKQIRDEIKQKVVIPGEVTLTLIRENRTVEKF